MSGQAITIMGQAWNLGPLIGSGGFGEVHMAESNGQIAAIKLVPKDPGADRELLFSDDLRDTPNVLPILGTGETATHWALLMPLADKSLRRYLAERGGPLSEAEALPVLANLTTALAHLADRGVVHRDLKPENILLHKGAWCLTDFGISRYTDATTATDTRKYSTTRPYMAPEQWREETATPAADVYALGVVTHELLAGVRPFPGPEFREQHLHDDPPRLTAVSPALAALIEQCLFKVPGTRPTAQDVLRNLERLKPSTPLSKGLADLHAANFEVVGQQAAMTARQQSEALTKEELRESLLPIARRQFEQIGNELKEAILSAVTPTSQDHSDYSWTLTLNASSISMQGVSVPNRNNWRMYLRYDDIPFDVIACGAISVGGGWKGGRTHSLWFCDAQEEGVYRWYETAFWHMAHFYEGAWTGRGQSWPTALAPWADRQGRMFQFDPSRSSEGWHIVWPFTPLEVGNLSEFIERWATWLAAVSRSELKFPRHNASLAVRQNWRNSKTPQEHRENKQVDSYAHAQDAIMDEFKSFLKATGQYPEGEKS
ncbi:serine/threonine-protein kinase [Catenulispora rubra]|uniref:serine/threonine-protein kinase n=1 Tax=Catenulispora rubra TaxID=280293 RepID=UPI0018920055|nr:serine/threonine-protein kinase [Catenulispora rubra]